MVFICGRENYDRQLTDIFAIQEDIAQSIVASLRVPLGLPQYDTRARPHEGFNLRSVSARQRADLCPGQALTEGSALLTRLLRDPDLLQPGARKRNGCWRPTAAKNTRF
jgi:hypothetical protein